MSERDVSEQCVRQVIPSIFLSKRVVDSNAYVLQLSRLELPYRCSIAIRTEPGNNIILAIQMTSSETLTSACYRHSEQMVVYEMADTFGGYWGPLPKDFVTHNPQTKTAQKEKYYTIKTTTPAPTTKKTKPSKPDPITEKASSITKPVNTVKSEDYDVITVELSLLNVSGVLVESDEKVMRNEDDNNTEIFDMIYDVAPRSDEKYDTSMVPLVQFSLSEEKNKNRDGKKRYELDYNLDESISNIFRSTKRHTMYPHANRYFEAWTRNYDSNLLKRRKPGKFTKRRNYNNRQRLTNIYNKNKNNYLPHKPLSTSASVSSPATSDSWEHVLALMKSFNKTFVDPSERTEEDQESHDLPKDIFEMKHNSSIYLKSNFSSYAKDKEFINKDIKRKITNRFQFNRFTKATRVFDAIRAEDKISEATKKHPIISETSTKNLKINDNYSSKSTKKNYTIISLTNGNSLQGQNTKTSSSPTQQNVQISVKPTSSSLEKTMVNHKSWENVVQVAEEIAQVLNHTTSTDTVDPSKKVKQVKKKRFIEAIPVHLAKPHVMSTPKQNLTTAKNNIDFTDIYEFANFIEPIDDQIHGHVDLRSLKKFISKAVYNICDYEEAKERQVWLFNSSRILLDFNNFTIKRLTIVATTARTLMNTENRCPVLTLECQVSGVRVCIDSVSACDGIPNCGSYDVYDEDRIQCGLAAGLQHNVYLAAFTFLAVLCTVLYTVHYWLKRCVPQVSEAFFIYSDGADNMLYLDSIMKSPLDDSNKLYYIPGAFEDEPDIQEEPTSFKNKLSSFFSYFRRKSKMKPVTSAQFHETHGELKEVYSFTECELNRMMGGRTASTSEAIVQTGDSLEMEFLEKLGKRNAHLKRSPPTEEESARRKARATEQQSYNELQMLRLCRDSRSLGPPTEPLRPTLSGTQTRNRRSIEEDEIRCFEYKDNSTLKKQDSLRVLRDPSEDAFTSTSHATRKRLRFDEGAIMISKSPSHSQEIPETRVKDVSKSRKSTEKTKKKMMR